MSFGELGEDVMNESSQEEAKQQDEGQAEQKEEQRLDDQSADESIKEYSETNQQDPKDTSENLSGATEKVHAANEQDDAKETERDQAPTPQPKNKKGRRRRASIRAEEDTEFLHFEVTPKSVGVLREYRQWQVNDRIDAIRKSIIFEKWSDEAIEMLAKMSMELMVSFPCFTLLFAVKVVIL
jgi:hypothetical protein